jgi:hypothetical protein
MADKQQVQSDTALGSQEQDAVRAGRDELDPGFIEERFRVDRKKLEQMLQGSFLFVLTSSHFAVYFYPILNMTVQTLH